MKAAHGLPDETFRLDTLRALNLLDTEPEERFDRVTRIARRLLDARYATIALVDRHRCWYKSRQGLRLTELPRDVSFCHHAIEQEDIMVVADALRDERFRDNPLVTGKTGVRFYAGCPLSAPNGARVGTLSLMGMRPRKLGHEEKVLLRDLANIAEQELSRGHVGSADELTGLYNRQGFLMLSRQALDFCERVEKPATLVFIDLDEFRHFNKLHGHVVGDRALMDFGNILLKVFRASDIIARLGNDEFVVLMTNCDRDHVDEALDRLYEELARYNRTRWGSGHPLKCVVEEVEYHMGKHEDIKSLLMEGERMMHVKRKKRRAMARKRDRQHQGKDVAQ